MCSPVSLLRLPPLPRVAVHASQDQAPSHSDCAVCVRPPVQPSPPTCTHTQPWPEPLLDESFAWFYWVEIEGFSNTVTDTKDPDYVLRHKSQPTLRITQGPHTGQGYAAGVGRSPCSQDICVKTNNAAAPPGAWEGTEHSFPRRGRSKSTGQRILKHRCCSTPRSSVSTSQRMNSICLSHFQRERLRGTQRSVVRADEAEEHMKA